MFVTLNYGFNLIDAKNWILANPLVTLTLIQLEWYFLFAFAFIRFIHNKLVGVAALSLSVTVLYIFTYGLWSLLIQVLLLFTYQLLLFLLLLEIKTFLILLFFSFSTMVNKLRRKQNESKPEITGIRPEKHWKPRVREQYRHDKAWSKWSSPKPCL